MGLYAKQTNANQVLDRGYLNEIANYNLLLRVYFYIFLLSGRVSGGCWLAALQEGSGLATVQEHLHGLVCHCANFWSYQRSHHGPVHLRHSVRPWKSALPPSLLTRSPHLHPGSLERGGGHISTFSVSLYFSPSVILVMSVGWKRPLSIEPVILGCIILACIDLCALHQVTCHRPEKKMSWKLKWLSFKFPLVHMSDHLVFVYVIMYRTKGCCFFKVNELQCSISFHLTCIFHYFHNLSFLEKLCFGAKNRGRGIELHFPSLLHSVC